MVDAAPLPAPDAEMVEDEEGAARGAGEDDDDDDPADAVNSSDEEDDDEEEEEEAPPPRQRFFCCAEDKKAGGFWYCPGGCSHCFHHACQAEHADLRDGQNKVCVPCHVAAMSRGRGARSGAKRPRAQ